ncbi:UDP-3-O-(3-hydroxymyristoyl)glucosamine N-acyltransferase [Arsukibacterium indicum]|uniref:UDP-3-O-acylglucosamine N-acyltransferase n=1 Tax=Arsukibacterium indicum TaxID=2848612 RepID=A0ABS6MHC0_9GAMM|nr:UDP-3-O-(3-hydroxymyristoyl)glucosamine N-acyltransferase [Arsukibacterium indicum]MBV2128210.1 UDP-3-O-(3-hydroxymyristoyl)glucosamine N-acyltransferase [Arsukibacterium indicum]
MKSLAELAGYLDAQLIGDAACGVSAVATLEHAGAGTISFLANSKYRKYLSQTKATAVLIKADDVPFLAPGVSALVVNDPYVAFALIAQMLDNTPAVATAIAPSAIIDATAVLGENCAVGPNAVISAGAVLGDNVQIGAGTVVGQGANVGSGSRLWANVTVYHNVIIGKNCLVHSGAVLGSDGFGFANKAGNWLKIPQTGTVLIGDNCEIGANTTIDRGAIEDTVIGNNVIIDNQCQIAHNVCIGDHTAIAGSASIAGSTTVGRYCVIGGGVGVNGHIEITDGVQITGMSMVTRSLTEKGVYSSGMPVAANAEWRRNTARLRQMEQLFQRVKQLEQQLQQLSRDGQQPSTED